MFVCENCGCGIAGEVYGTGDDATGYCSFCKDHVHCYDDDCFDDEESLPALDANEFGL